MLNINLNITNEFRLIILLRGLWAIQEIKKIKNNQQCDIVINLYKLMMIFFEYSDLKSVNSIFQGANLKFTQTKYSICPSKSETYSFFGRYAISEIFSFMAKTQHYIGVYKMIRGQSNSFN